MGNERKEAEVNMEGHFLVRQIYEDDVTYNIVGAAERVLSKSYRIRIQLARINSTEFYSIRLMCEQRCQPIFCWKNSARNSSISAKIPVTIEFCKYWEPHLVISYRYFIFFLFVISPVV